MEKETVIIDYKTGDPLKVHEDQVNEYANYISEIGYQIQKKILVYLYPTVTIKII